MENLKRIGILFFIIAAVILTFSPSIFGELLNWDDTLYLQNYLIQDKFSFKNLIDIYHFDKHISLTLISFKIQNLIFGENHSLYHLVNIFFHLLNTVLIFLISKKLKLSENVSIFIAIVFAIHPFKAESVNWIIQRKDLLYSFFFLLSILVYFKILNNNKNIFYPILLYFLALFSVHSKIQAYTLPLVLILISWYNSKSDIRYFLFNIVLFLLMLNPLDNLFYGILFSLLGLVIIVDFNISLGKIKLSDYINIDVSEKIRHIGFAIFYLIIVITLFLNIIAFFDDLYFRWILDLLSLILFIYILMKMRMIIKSKYKTKFTVLIFVLLFILLFLSSLEFDFPLFLDISIPYLIFYSSLAILCLFLVFIPKSDLLDYFNFSNNLSLLLEDIKSKLLYIIFLSGLILPNLIKVINLNLILLYLISLLSIFSKYQLKLNIYNIKLIKKNTLFFLIMSIFVLLLIIVTKTMNIDYYAKFNFIKTIIYASYSFVYYLCRIFYFWNLNPMHPYPEGEFDFVYFFSPFIFVFLIAVIVYLLSKIYDQAYKKKIIFGLLFFVINILIVSHLIPIKGKVIVADRYVYLASFGIFFSIGSFYERFFESFKYKKFYLKIITVFIITLMAIETYSYSKIWKNDFTFWSYVIAKDSTNHYAIYSLGLYYYEKNDFKTALEKYNTAISLFDKNPEYFLNRGVTNYRLGFIENSLKDLDRAISLNPSDHIAYKNRGIILFETGELEKAIVDFEKSLRLYSEDKFLKKIYSDSEILLKQLNDNVISSVELSEYYFRVGEKYVKFLNYEKALEYFNKSIEKDSLSIKSYKNRGNIYAMNSNFDLAISDYRKILELNPEDSGVLMNLGNVLHQSGNYVEGCKCWEKAYQLGEKNANMMIEKFCR